MNTRILSGRIRRRTLALGLGVACTSIAFGGVALAYWSTTGTGTGSATTSAPQAVTISTSGTAGALLQPGGTGDLVISVINPNGYSVQITAVSATGGATPSDGPGTCSTTGVSISVPNGDLPKTIPANESNYRLVLAGAVSMDVTSDSGCQGRSFTIPLSLTVIR